MIKLVPDFINIQHERWFFNNLLKLDWNWQDKFFLKIFSQLFMTLEAYRSTLSCQVQL